MKRYARISYIFAAYFCGVLFFLLFRLAGTLVYCLSVESWPDFGGLYPYALYTGWRFDTVISCYIMALPILMLLAAQVARIRSNAYHLVAHYIMVVLFIVSFFACAADIPFFAYFFTRLNAVAMHEVESFGIIVDMIVSEPKYILGMVAFAVVAVAYWFVMRWIYRRILRDNLNEARVPYAVNISLALVLIFGTFVGMRGRLSAKSPIRVGTAYFCGDPFLNQIGLNPVFTLIKSAGELGKAANRPFEVMPPMDAQQVRLEEQRTPMDSTLMLPGLSLPLPDGTNVVLVIMESMAVNKTGMLNPQSSLTPNLDTLMAQSLLFTRTYSAGIHTYNGIYSTLYSSPGIPARHTLYHTYIPHCDGIPWALRGQGYSTAYFMTHDEDYDNMRGFLLGNGFDSVVGQHCYPRKEVVGTWGVPDHKMLDHALAHCNAMAAKGPFFTTVMTCSDHVPYIFPKDIDFVPQSKEPERRMVEYADWALGRFMRKASGQSWFGNTLFVFVADHGGMWGKNLYDEAIPYHHVPMLFYMPGHIKPQRCDRLALQIDLGPTLLGMLPFDYPNQTFGLDLLRQQRKFAYFISDDKIAAMDGEYYYIYRLGDDIERMYRYCDSSTTNEIESQRERADIMKRYAFGLVQASQIDIR